MASKTLTIPPFTIPQGAHVFGPVTPNGQWSHFTLSLDITNAASFDVLAEESLDDGLTWQAIVSCTGVAPYVKHGIPVNALALDASWDQVRGSTQVRVTTTSLSAFASAGGSIVLS